MNSNSRYFPPTENTENGNKFDYSPFESRRKKYKTFEQNQKLNLRSKHRSKRIQKFLPFKNDHNNTSSLISSKRNLDLIEDNDEEDRSITPDPDQANSIVTVNEKILNYTLCRH